MVEAQNSSPLACLTIGLSAELGVELQVMYSKISRRDMPYDLDRLMEDEGPIPAVIICGEPPPEVSVSEVAQTLRMKYSNLPIYLIAGPGSRFDRKTLIKNGLNDVFFMPLDREMLSQNLADIAAAQEKGGKTFRSVKLMDMEADSVLDFDTYVYLPANNKHIRYSAAGGSIEKERLEKLKRHEVSSIFVATQDMPKVYEHAAQVLRKLGESDAISETERSERLQSSVRDLISGLFSDAATGTDGGKSAIEDCQAVVRKYISGASNTGWYERLLTLAGGESGTHARAANIAACASLFAIAVGNKNTEEIAIAALLHDIGLANVPSSIQHKNIGEMTPLERNTYERHPEFSIEMIRERKLVIPQLSHQIILQHHECFNGSGFPKGIRGTRFIEEAQILAFADRFEDLTALKSGLPRMTPLQAARELSKMCFNDPSKSFIDPTLMKKLVSLFPNSSKEPEGR